MFIDAVGMYANKWGSLLFYHRLFPAEVLMLTTR